MDLIAALLQNQKPLATCLVDDIRRYHPDAVVNAVNFARASGRAQILASVFSDVPNSEIIARECEQLLESFIKRAKAEIAVLSEIHDEFEIIVEKTMESTAVINIHTKHGVRYL
jgi:hypothetical protein